MGKNREDAEVRRVSILRDIYHPRVSEEIVYLFKTHRNGLEPVEFNPLNSQCRKIYIVTIVSDGRSTSSSGGVAYCMTIVFGEYTSYYIGALSVICKHFVGTHHCYYTHVHHRHEENPVSGTARHRFGPFFNGSF